MKAEIERLEALVYVPGLWACAKCQCQVVSNTMYTQSGTIGPNNKPQVCPNDCGPMWRVTERDAGNRVADRLIVLTGKIRNLIENCEGCGGQGFEYMDDGTGEDVTAEACFGCIDLREMVGDHRNYRAERAAAEAKEPRG